MTAIEHNGRYYQCIVNEEGRWVLSTDAKTWLRCTRCRKPYEVTPSEKGWCPTCFLYKSGFSFEEFQKHRDEWRAKHPHTRNWNISPKQEIMESGILPPAKK